MKYESSNNRTRQPTLTSRIGNSGFDGGYLQLTCSAADTLKTGIQMNWTLPNNNLAMQVRSDVWRCQCTQLLSDILGRSSANRRLQNEAL